MHFKSLILAPFIASGVTNALPQAAPTESPLPGAYGAAFSVMALRSASDIHFARVSAAKRSLFLKLPNQNACCDRETDGTATFYKKDGELFLYAIDKPDQQIFVDRSGMGQGKIGYITGDQSPPRNAELDGWEVDEVGNLSFNGAGLIACPNSIEGSWSIWVSVGVGQPAGNKDCLGFSARALNVADPISCVYTEQ